MSYRILLFAICMYLCFASSAEAQHILAGKHGLKDCFTDLIPDSTITGTYNHFPPYVPPAEFHIDMNSDGVKDLYFYASGGGGLGGGSSASILYASDSNCQFVSTTVTDVCVDKGTAYNNIVAYPYYYSQGDTIDAHQNWSSLTSLKLAYNNWTLNGNCSGNNFPGNPQGSYIALRLLTATDTSYGWIKINAVGNLTVTVEEYAINCKNTGISTLENTFAVYPNPFSESIAVDNPYGSNSNLEIYDIFGNRIAQQKLLSSKNEIKLKHVSKGIYLMKISNNKGSYCKKIIRQ